MVKSKLKYSFKLSNLCSPAMIYFVISLVALLMLGVQNLNKDENILCIGNYKCGIASKTLVFLLNAVYIVFWTFLLDLMCKAGYKELSWLVLLIPILLFFLFLGAIIYQSQII